MDAINLNNLNNTYPLNISCDSIIAPSEEDNNLDKSGTVEAADRNIDHKIIKPTEDKQNFRELLQNRVLKRLHEKAEYGKRNVEAPDKDTLPLKGFSSNEDLWKRVEDRVAAKKANNENTDKLVDSQKLNYNVAQSSSSEDIKYRIRNMSKAIGLASSIQNEITTSEKENSDPVSTHFPPNIPCTADFLSQSARCGLEQQSSIYGEEETLSQGRFMEDDYYSLPSVGSTQSLFSNISEYRTFVHDTRADDALVKYLQSHSNILQDQDAPLTETRLLQYATELSGLMKDIQPDPDLLSYTALLQDEDLTPVASPRSFTPTNEKPRSWSRGSLTDELVTPIRDTLTVSPNTMSRDIKALMSHEKPVTSATLTVNDTSIDRSPVLKESAAQCKEELLSVSFSDATIQCNEEPLSVSFSDATIQCNEEPLSVSFSDATMQTSIVFEEIPNSGNSTHVIDSQSTKLCSDTNSRNDQPLESSKKCDEEHSNSRLPDFGSETNRDSSTPCQSVTMDFTGPPSSATGTTSSNTGSPSASCERNDGDGMAPIPCYVSPPRQTVTLPVASDNESRKDGKPPCKMSIKKQILMNLAQANLSYKIPKPRSIKPTPAADFSLLSEPEVIEQENCTLINIPCENMNHLDKSNIQVIEQENCTLINIPCENMNHLDKSNIQVMMNFRSDQDGGGTAKPTSTASSHHHHHGILECNSIPQFEEAEVDAIFENLHYEDKEKREKMRRLLNDLDAEHFLNSVHQDITGDLGSIHRNFSGDSNTLTRTTSIISSKLDSLGSGITPRHNILNLTPTPRGQESGPLSPPHCDKSVPFPPELLLNLASTPRVLTVSPRESSLQPPSTPPENALQATLTSLYKSLNLPFAGPEQPLSSTTEFLRDDSMIFSMISPSFIYDVSSPRAPPRYFSDSSADLHEPSQDDDALSFPSIPSFFDDYESDIAFKEMEFGCSPDLYEQSREDLADLECASVDSCSTVVLNNCLKSDLSSKGNQTLAMPFRLVKFLPFEKCKEISYDELEDMLGVEVHENAVAVQVDLSPDLVVSSEHDFASTRKELNWLDRAAQNEAAIIKKQVSCC